MADTDIEYLTKSWNPLQSKIKGPSGNGYHCTRIDDGCKFCWAEGMNHRFGNKLPFNAKPQEFEIKKSELHKPFGWRMQQRVGVQFMGDLFHKDVPFKLIDKVFDVMATDLVQRKGKAGEREGEEAFREITRHKYFVLTKRPERILEFINWVKENGDSNYPFAHELDQDNEIPSRIWLGTSISDQTSANKRVVDLLKIKQVFPSANLWLSVEPMLGEIDLSKYFYKIITDFQPKYASINSQNGQITLAGTKKSEPAFGWVVCGGESGKGARPTQPDWVRSVRDQCKAAGVPFNFKQWGNYTPIDYGEFGQSLGKALAANMKNVVTMANAQMVKVGKKKAGRLLDGVLHDEYPVGV